MVPDVYAWDAWHPRVVAERLTGIQVPWYVAAGWALDLYHGRQTRDHEDLEIAVPAERFTEIAVRFPDCEFHVVGDGGVSPVSVEALRTHHQTWALEKATRVWRFDVFREPHDGDTWICRRDTHIRRPYTEIIEHDQEGIPYLAPEMVLLFKAKAQRAKDQADLDGTVPLLDEHRRIWLRHALAVVHPGHAWLDLLDTP
jgi:aminoglycoside-2''-adenylyltransferase